MLRLLLPLLRLLLLIRLLLRLPLLRLLLQLLLLLLRRLQQRLLTVVPRRWIRRERQGGGNKREGEREAERERVCVFEEDDVFCVFLFFSPYAI